MASDPEQIGKFRITGLLGRGAMGVVYKAHDPDIDRSVAIKLVRTDLLDSTERAHYVERFRNEARLVGRCVHPNIVGIHDFSTFRGDPFLVLEFVDGSHLGRISREPGFDLARFGRVMLQVLDALSYAHGFGIVHRDIKPANILLAAANGAAKVTDFGISRALTGEATMSSFLVGTPCYMSPEQCLGEAVDGRSDLFSLGCVLYEILGGERAFGAANYVATTQRILHDEPTPLRQRAPHVSPALAAVVHRALAKQRQERFQDAAGMAAALREALSPSGSDAAPPGPDATDLDAPTVVASPRGAPESIGTMLTSGSLEASSLATIERALASHVGPVARLHVRRALRDATTPEALCDHLAGLLPPGHERDTLLDTMRRTIAADPIVRRSWPGTATGSGSGLAPEVIARYERALAQIVGPIAPRLLRRALATTRTPDALEAACLALIADPADAQRFRRALKDA